MRLDIGPFTADGGQEWIAQARFLVRLIRKHQVMPFQVPPEVLDEFESYFEDWERASATEPFCWSREVEVGTLRTLMTYWLNLAQMLADHPEQQPPGSPEARAFYRTLSSAILAALVEADPASAAIAERWPFV
jgi:hypothetical protein